MAYGVRNGAFRQIRAIYSVGTFAGLSDGQLLERFTSREGEAAELAFAALVERHGPMVHRVCRRVLRDAHDAQDAFQAAFLVLVRKAGSLRDRETVGHWLYGVASRVALDARASAFRRRKHEGLYAEGPPKSSAPEAIDFDLEAAIHEEIGRLPERYRAPVVLCHLEGLSHEEAAGRLGRPVGTVRSRLARGRERLKGGLARRGLAPSAGVLAASLSTDAPGAMPRALIDLAAKTAVRSWAARSARGMVPQAVAALARGETRSMLLAKIKLVATALTAFSTVAAGAGMLATYQDGPKEDGAPAAASTTDGPPPAEAPGTRSEAIGKYLDKTKKEVDAAVTGLRDEVKDLRAKLEQAEANLRRLEAIQASLDGKASPLFFETTNQAKAFYGSAKSGYGQQGATWPSYSKPDTGQQVFRAQEGFRYADTFKAAAAKNKDDAAEAARKRDDLDRQIKKLTEERDRLGKEKEAASPK